MSAPRYVIDVRLFDEVPDRQYVQTLDLPDAEHIHLTRLPDGRWTAVAMELFGHWDQDDASIWWPQEGPNEDANEVRLWVDVEEAGA